MCALTIKTIMAREKKKDLLKIVLIHTIAELMQEKKLHKEEENPIQDLKGKIGNNHYYKKSIWGQTFVLIASILITSICL